MQFKFNYIITIHNKEHLIKDVLLSVLLCCRDNSRVYPVLDGCTDKTEAIIDSIIEKYCNIPITKVYAPDVHEIMSINAGLRAANQEGEGFNIILQDDVVLADFTLEDKVSRLYNFLGEDLGAVSFRLGANFKPAAETNSEPVPFNNYVESAFGHGLSNVKLLLPGHFAHRTIPIKSPICLPFRLVRSVGYLEERLAPYMHDDTEYAIRSINSGFRNGVFGIRFYSDISWGGTRSNPHPQMAAYTRRNMDIIREIYGSTITNIINRGQADEMVVIPGMVDEDETCFAMNRWEQTKASLLAYQRKANLKPFTVLNKILSLIKGK